MVYIAGILVFLLAYNVQAGERYALAGYVAGQDLLGSDEAKPSSPALVVGTASDQLWGRARMEVEAQVTRHWQGLAVGLRLDVLDRWHLMAGTGAGVLDADLDWQSDGLNFLLQGGVGFHVRDWRVDLRLHHISNARLRSPNRGTNGVLVLVGRRW